MKYLIPLLLILAGCGTRPVSAVVRMTPDGENVYMTREVYDAQFGDSVVMDRNLTTRIRCGHYDLNTHICYAIARDPAHPTETERAWMLHEIGHRLMEEHGWDDARGTWRYLAWYYPAVMTHADINNRLKSEGLWPSMFGPAAP